MNELLKLTKENNIMLKYIISHIKREDNEDFIKNIIANVIGNKLEM